MEFADPQSPDLDPQVLCLGEALIDRIVPSTTAATDAPGWEDCPGGALANVATALAKLGTPVGFVGALGRDRAADSLWTALVSAGVNGAAVQRCDAPTRVVLVHRDAQGDRQFVGFLQPEAQFADTLFQADQLPEAWFGSGKYLVMGTLGLAAPATGGSMRQALTWARHRGLITVVDVNWRPPFWPQPEQARDRILPFLSAVDVLKLSQEEADWLFGTRQAEAVRAALPQVRLVVVTGGAAGCWYAAPDHQGHVPSFAVPCQETTGAGDAFLAGLIHGLIREHLPLGDAPQAEEKQRLIDVLRFANAAGALTTTRPGAMAAQPTAAAIAALINQG